jgi:hypothetical protein
MPPAQFDLLTRQILGVSERLDELIESLTGDGERIGVYGRIRNLEAWQNDHISTHNAMTHDRRSLDRDWRLFWLKVIEHAIAVAVGAAIVLLVFALTGQVVKIP